nr:hypothetical protein GCM10020093_077660 [Planobispora longispora]
MHVAIPLYPRFTALDAVGPYTVLAFTPGWSVTFVAAAPGPVTDDRGSLAMTATASFEDVPRPDVILVPGGPGTPPPWPTRPCSPGSAPRTSTRGGPPRSAAVPSSSARPAC